MILRAEGNEVGSRGELAQAFKKWQAIGCELRAARAAVELCELGGGDVYRSVVARELQLRPNSFYAARARLAA